MVSRLEPNALKAVKEEKRNVALTAGPGAGKTELLDRDDFLLRAGLCSYPQRILAISFKVDASRNLKERVRLSGVVQSPRPDELTVILVSAHASRRLIDLSARLFRRGSDAAFTIGECAWL